MQTVVVVVPWYRESLSDDERVSLSHLLHFLGDREIRVLKPEGLPGTLGGRQTLTFADHHFDSVETYSKLLLSTAFYGALEDYEWLLIHQLDALVLSSQLDPWLDAEWDYVGAPWPAEDPKRQGPFARVGNGGLCLRRVPACRRVLEHGSPPPLAAAYLTAELPDLDREPMARRLRRRLRILREVGRGIEWYAANYSLNEDRFWSDRAHLFDRAFRVAPVADGLRFAFETAPAQAFELTGGRLPFGAHAWATHDRTFWEPHLLANPAAAGGAS